MSKQTTAVSIFAIVVAALVLVAAVASVSVTTTSASAAVDSAAIGEVRAHLNEARMAAQNNDMAGVQTHLGIADMKLAELGGGNMTSTEGGNMTS
jgi:hypothetical protein